jgi:hypothetical protein
MTTTRNRRSLEAIAADIFKLERQNVFEVGALLIEAKESHPGEFLQWLSDYEWWSADTAENFMRVARLARRFRNIRNLKLGKTTLYWIAKQPEEEQTAIVEDLAKVATRKLIRPREAYRIMTCGQVRRVHGNLPDETLLAIGRIGGSAPVRDALIAALKDAKPTTEEAAREIAKRLWDAHYARDEQADDGGGEADDDEADTDTRRTSIARCRSSRSPEASYAVCAAADSRERGYWHRTPDRDQLSARAVQQAGGKGPRQARGRPRGSTLTNALKKEARQSTPIAEHLITERGRHPAPLLKHIVVDSE